MGIFIGILDTYLAQREYANMKYGKQLKNFVITGVVKHDGKININENIKNSSHVYCFEYVYDKSYHEFMKRDIICYENCAILNLMNLDDLCVSLKSCMIGLLIEFPTIASIKLNNIYDDFFHIYLQLRVMLCDDVIKIIFKDIINPLIYKYYRDSYGKKILKLPKPTDISQQYVINKRMMLFDNCFKTWFDNYLFMK